MGEPSAILAINSLDRYITTDIPVTNALEAFWFANTNEIFYNYFGGPKPQIGAVVTSTGPGWPAGFITIIGLAPVATSFFISAPTTAQSFNPLAIVIQTYNVPAANQPRSNSLVAQYQDLQPYSNNFRIQSPGALIYGYINRIIVSQIQLQYNIPTVCKNLNDNLIIGVAGPEYASITIPHGFYYADELATILQELIRADFVTGPLNMTVTFVPRDGFQFVSTAGLPFYFPDPAQVNPPLTVVFPTLNILTLYKTYKLLGMTNANAIPAVNQTSFDYPNFLYTPYIDFYSDILTNYQNIKDTNTSVSKPKGLVARLYVSGTGQIQTTGSVSALGTAPFVMTSDLNTPKVIRWTPDVAVPSIDFQLLDQYGDEIPGAAEGHSTEFQMTLLCVEGRD